MISTVKEFISQIPNFNAHNFFYFFYYMCKQNTDQKKIYYISCFVYPVLPFEIVTGRHCFNTEIHKRLHQRKIVIIAGQAIVMIRLNRPAGLCDILAFYVKFISLSNPIIIIIVINTFETCGFVITESGALRIALLFISF